MKPKYQPLLRHQDHKVEIRPSKNAVHFAYYYCLKCQCHISWISKRAVEQARLQDMITK